MGKMLLHFTIAISVLTLAHGNANIYSDAVQELTLSGVKFAVNLYKELIRGGKSRNVIFSPFSVSSALAMTRLGAKGNSSMQINDVLQLDKIEAGLLTNAFAELNGLLFDKPNSNITLEGASCAFVSNKRQILEDYKNALNTFGATIKELDFTGGKEDSIKKMNKWISDKTDGLIPDMLTEDSVTADTALMLVSTLYFSGEWHSGFYHKQTVERDFHVSHYRIIKTPFMYQRGKFKFGYIESLGLQVLEMPYVNQEISMIILLPDNFELPIIEHNLNYDNLTNWLSTTKYETVDLTFPKFNLNEMTDLKSSLQRMGIKDIFDAKADLSGMTSDKSLYVDAMMHKGVLEVSYNGGEVEAERAEANQTPGEKRRVVYADHPFIFLVRNKKTNVLYLMGAFKRPAGVERGHDEL